MPRVVTWLRVFLGAVPMIAAAALVIAAPARGEATLRLIVPAAAGGAGDTLARIVADALRQPSQPVIVENHPGAGTVLGSNLAARARPDGATLLINGPYLLIAAQQNRLAFDPLTALAPICQLVSSPGVFTVHRASPYRTLADLTRPGASPPTISGAGPATLQEAGVTLLGRAAGAELQFVPYPGGAGAVQALLGRHVTAAFTEYAAVAAHLRSGELRALATTSAQRLALLPDVATVAATYPGFEIDFWWGVFAPAETPPPSRARLESRFAGAIAGTRAKLASLGFLPTAVCGAPFATLLGEQYARFGRTGSN